MLPPRRIASTATLLALLAVLAAGCGSSDSTAAPAEAVAVTWQKPATKTDEVGYETLKAGEMELLAKTVAHTFELPEPLTVEGVNGSGDGPAYDSEDNAVTFPYGFAAMTAEAVQESAPGSGEAEVAERTKEIDELILAHVFGHALIGNYGLNAHGEDEETEADEIATLLLLQTVAGVKNGSDASIFLADFTNRSEPAALIDYTQAHALDLGPSIDILCWLAGSSKQAHKEIVETGVLGGATQCPGEFAQMSKRISKQLESHLASGASLQPVP
ncbi:MAG TPA: DUF4344 domain-containing metallopeptidase [Solirubrobacterales bacterium]|nr:DUF4344 domain-containing metallopeptidase [Solirubrobacterales bacterium]